MKHIPTDAIRRRGSSGVGYCIGMIEARSGNSHVHFPGRSQRGSETYPTGVAPPHSSSLSGAEDENLYSCLAERGWPSAGCRGCFRQTGRFCWSPPPPPPTPPPTPPTPPSPQPTRTTPPRRPVCGPVLTCRVRYSRCHRCSAACRPPRRWRAHAVHSSVGAK
jgi:hypothetical protein